MLKRILLAATLLAAAMGSSLHAEKALGVSVGYATRAEAPVAGIFFQMDIIPHLRVAPSFNYQFRHNGCDALQFDLDFHSPWAVGAGVKLYPLVGVSVARWNISAGGIHENFDRIGFNAGGGAEWSPIGSSLKLFIEGKYNAVSDFGSGYIKAGIGYKF
jgi:hypothetical protein